MITVLVVDDVAANRNLLGTVLRHQGYTVLEAPDGERALRTARAERPDLVVTDVLMPAMDGYEFVRQLRLDPATRGIPVVFHTAHYGEREARELALASGVSWVLTKPAASAVVVETVKRALASGSAPSVEAPSNGDSFNHEHLRLITDKLWATNDRLRSANARLRALINIGMDLASESDSDRLLETVCVAAHDLFGASYVTLGLVNRNTVQRVLSYGTDPAGGIVDALWITSGERIPGMLAPVVEKRVTLMGENPGGGAVALLLPPQHPTVQAYLVAPVASPGRIYGWLFLVCNEERSFDEDDRQMVVALSGQLGRVYEASRLHHAGRERLSDLERELVVSRAEVAKLRTERDARQRLRV